MSFSVVSLNARGLRDVVKRKALFLFSRPFGSDGFFFQESHSNDKDITFWKLQWSSEIWFSFLFLVHFRSDKKFKANMVI